MNSDHSTKNQVVRDMRVACFFDHTMSIKQTRSSFEVDTRPTSESIVTAVAIVEPEDPMASGGIRVQQAAKAFF